VADLDAWCRDPSWIDRDGKFQWADGVPVVGFGKHRGTPMASVEDGFWRWMLRNDFSPEVKRMVESARRGVYPVQAREEPGRGGDQ